MRKWSMGTVLALTVWLGLTSASAGFVSPNSWRPYVDPTVLVTLGMTKEEVLVKAGRPATPERLPRGAQSSRSITVWTYRRTGHNAEVATLTFKGNRLVKIELNLLKP